MRPAEQSRGLLASRPLTAFALLAFGLSWAVWVPAALLAPDGALMPIFLLGAFGPAAAAAVMVRAGGGSLRAWVRDMAVFRVPLRWYLAALGVALVQPVAVTAVAALGGVPLDFGVLPARVPAFLVSVLVVALVGGGQEEPGWRGYLLPRLQRRTSPLAASAAIGVLWALWHLPLFVFGFDDYGDRSFLLYLPSLVGLAVILTWLYNATSGSVVLAILLHAGFNSSGALVPAADTATSDAGLQHVVQAVLSAVLLVLAAALVARHGTRLAARPLGPEVTGSRVGDAAATASRPDVDRRGEASGHGRRTPVR